MRRSVGHGISLSGVVRNKIFLGDYMCAFQCDSCFHKQVCTDEPNTRALNEECALYANVKNFTYVQQPQPEIALCKELLDYILKWWVDRPEGRILVDKANAAIAQHQAMR